MAFLKIMNCVSNLLYESPIFPFGEKFPRGRSNRVVVEGSPASTNFVQRFLEYSGQETKINTV